MDRSKVKVILLSTIATVLILGLIFYTCINKPSIITATYAELTDIYGIGGSTAQDIIYYCDANKNAVVEDLEYINGIGWKTVDILKERWK